LPAGPGGGGDEFQLRRGAMDPIFGHPLWVSSGVLMMLGGGLLIHWSRRNNVSDEIAHATREAAVNKLFRGGRATPADSALKKLPANHFRRAMSQLAGIVGFLLIIAGLTSAFFGVFYEAS
jgi:hypothetical protein